MSDLSFPEIGLILVVLGFLLVFVAVILLALKSTSGEKTRGAGVLLIGPIPIIFGSDRESVKLLVVLAIVLMGAVLVFLMLPSFLNR